MDIRSGESSMPSQIHSRAGFALPMVILVMVETPSSETHMSWIVGKVKSLRSNN